MTLVSVEDTWGFQSFAFWGLKSAHIAVISTVLRLFSLLSENMSYKSGVINDAFYFMMSSFSFRNRENCKLSTSNIIFLCMVEYVLTSRFVGKTFFAWIEGKI